MNTDDSIHFIVPLKDAWERLNDIKRHEDGRGMPFTLPMFFMGTELVVPAAALTRVERDLELFHSDLP